MSLDDYLFVMAQEHVDFRLPELNSICELIGKNDSIKDHNYSDNSPVFSCRLENDQLANEIAKRCILLKFIIKLYNRADNFDSLLNEIKKENKQIKYEKNDTFKIDIYTFGKIYSQNERINIIENLISALNIDENEMKVCLKENEVKHRFYYVEDWIETDDGKKRTLRGCYFGKFVCNGQSTVSNKYSLKERGFIGNTSMDPQLALIMSNMAHCVPNSLVYDPFVGTGSILVGAAHFGAHVAGADLDYNLIHSRGLSSRAGQKYRRKDQTIRSNLQQYGLESSFIDIFVADFARPQVIRHSFEFDSIVSDPPYGIREKTKRTVGRNDENREDIEQNASSKSYVKQTKYQLGDIYYDLLDFAFTHLVVGGRLVFWLPVYLEEAERKSMNQNDLLRCLEAFIPKHSGLELVVFSEQRLNRSTSRILVTMKKKPTTSNECKKSLEANNVENDTIPSPNSSHLNQFREKYFSVKK